MGYRSLHNPLGWGGQPLVMHIPRKKSLSIGDHIVWPKYVGNVGSLIYDMGYVFITMGWGVFFIITWKGVLSNTDWRLSL